jgi:hypothetical protein
MKINHQQSKLEIITKARQNQKKMWWVESAVFHLIVIEVDILKKNSAIELKFNI